MRTLDMLKATGRALSSFSNSNRNEAFHFAVELTDEMYPNNRFRRDWAHANIMLAYDNTRKEVMILDELT